MIMLKEAAATLQNRITRKRWRVTGYTNDFVYLIGVDGKGNIGSVRKTITFFEAKLFYKKVPGKPWEKIVR